MLSVGMIGCGAVAHMNYAHALLGRSAYAVQRVFDLNEAQARSAASLYAAQVSTLDELLENSDIVVVTTPPDSHAQLVEKSLKAGRIVLCEKPFMTRGQDAERLAALASTVGAKLYAGYFRRTFPQLRLARDLVQTGAIGDVVGIDASEGGRFTWKTASDYISKNPSGGVIWDTGSHTMDMALFASGLDLHTGIGVTDVQVKKDRSEPSHHIDARFNITRPQLSAIPARLRLSRKEALPCVVRIAGTRGVVSFLVGADTRVRLTSTTNSVVVQSTEPDQKDLMGFFDQQIRRIFLGEQQEDFFAERFIGLTRILEALTHA